MSELIDNRSPELEWTGERYVPSVHGDVELEHLHRYAVARALAGHKVVLDIACGEGYGTNILAEVAQHVTGVDLSPRVIEHAAAKYRAGNVAFRVGTCSAIPVASHSVDLVVSFETIAHHAYHDEMMKEIQRVLRPQGTLIISSPDKHEYSDVPRHRHPYHIKELYLDELRDLLGAFFRNVSIYGQRVSRGSYIAPLGRRRSRDAFASFRSWGLTIRGTAGVERPIYFVAVASNAPLPGVPVGLLSAGDQGSAAAEPRVPDDDGGITSLVAAVRDREAQVAALSVAIAERDQRIVALDEALRDRERQTAALSSEIAGRDQRLTSLASAMRERDAHVATLEDRIRASEAALSEGDARLAAMTARLVRHEAQAAMLQATVDQRDAVVAALGSKLVERDAQIAALRSTMVDDDLSSTPAPRATNRADGQEPNPGPLC